MFATIWIPRFRLQAALRWGNGTGAVALVDDQSAKSRILEVSPEAEAWGVSRDMPTTQAMARCPELRVLVRSLAKEQACNGLLIQVAGQFAADIEHAAAGAVTMDLRRARKGTCWQQLGEGLRERLSVEQLIATIGVATNPEHALLAARCAESVNVIYDGRAFCAGLELEALDPSPELLSVLRDWGVESIGDLVRLPKDGVVERLGPEARALLERVTGRARRPLRLVRAVEEFIEAFEFEHPVETTEPLLFILRRFLESLSVRLKESQRVVSRMRLVLALDGGADYERLFSIPAPTSDVETLFSVLATHLESLQLERQVVGVRLRIDPAPASNRQMQFFSSELRDPNRFAETLARLKALFGEDRIGTPEKADTHRPGGATRLMEPDFAASVDLGGLENRLLGLPLRRLETAWPAQVRLFGAVPAHLTARGRSCEVVRAAGPYRLSGEWWDREAWGVEEWDVELAGGSGLMRLARRRAGWSVEGVYDIR
jgi:protein ImuB